MSRCFLQSQGRHSNVGSKNIPQSHSVGGQSLFLEQSSTSTALGIEGGKNWSWPHAPNEFSLARPWSGGGVLLPMDASPSIRELSRLSPGRCPRGCSENAWLCSSECSSSPIQTRDGNKARKWKGGVVTPIRVRLHCMWCRRHGRPGEKNPGGVSSSRFPWRTLRRLLCIWASHDSDPIFRVVSALRSSTNIKFRVFLPKYRVHPPVTQRSSDQNVTRYSAALAYRAHCLASRRHGNGHRLTAGMKQDAATSEGLTTAFCP